MPTFRWLVKRSVYDYFNADSDPKLQINYDGVFWKDIPTVVIEHDMRSEISKPVLVPKEQWDALPKMPEYPYTAVSMEY